MLRWTLSEFCYWLQGAIEIGGLARIDDSQRQMILSRLRLVNETHPFLIHAALLLRSPEEENFAVLAANLQRVFQHDIDPSYTGDQTFLQGVHDGTKEP